MAEIENLCTFKTHAEVPRSYKKYVALITDDQEVIYHPEMSIKLTTEAGCKVYVKEICDEEVLTFEGFVFKKGISTKEGQKMYYTHTTKQTYEEKEDGTEVEVEYDVIQKVYIPNDTPYGFLHDTPIIAEYFLNGELADTQTLNSDDIGSNKFNLLEPGTSTIEVPKIIGGGDSVKFVLPDSYFRFDYNTSLDSYSSITNVELSRTIDKIADYAFCNCQILKEVILPSNLKEIGRYAFGECVALTNINIPEGVSVLQEGTFNGCNKMSGVTLPSTLTYIGDSCFRQCNALTHVDLPQSLSEIDYNAFAYCGNLTSLTIPDSVTCINSGAFAYCSNLTSITIPDSITCINSDVFAYCSNLTSITIPDSVTYIDSNAFAYCGNIESITIGSGTTLASSAFSNISINYDDIHWVGHDGLELRSYGVTIADIVRNSEGYEIFQNRVVGRWDSTYKITQVNLPNTVTAINDNVFKDCFNLQTLNMPEGLESIGVEAFSNCTSLSSITIPSTVTYIGENAFKGCRIRGLENVSWIGHSDFDISDYGGIAYDVQVIDGMVIEGDTLTGCVGSLTEAVIPNQVKIIGFQAFVNQTNLTSVTLPSGLTYIDYSAFDSTGITEITIPSNVTTIEYGAFSMCRELKTVNILSPNVNLDGAFAYCYLDRNNISWVDHEIPTDFGGAYMVTEQNDGLLIRENAAYKCRAFATDVTIPNTVTSINKSAFYNIQSLSSVTIPSSVVNIQKTAFRGCTNLTSIRIPNSGATIAQDAFGYCDNLDTIYFDGSVTRPYNEEETYGPFSANNAIVLPTNNIDGLQIEDGILKGCARYISNLVIPNTVTAIGFKAFGKKRTWQTLYNTFSAVTIPDSVISISGSAFEGMSALQTASIPSSVTDFGDSIFKSTGLKDVTISEGVTCIPFQMFNYCQQLTSITLPSTINKIDGYAFDYCGSLSIINIPTSVTVMGTSAFGYCKKLTSITIPSGMTSIPNECFFHCDSLSEITISETIKSIGTWAYAFCSGLTEVSIPQSITAIPERAFAQCLSLTSVTMYDNVSQINVYAFNNCPNLTAIYYSGSAIGFPWGAENATKYEGPHYSS